MELQTLKCLISWVQFGVTIMDLENVLPVVFEATRNPELFDTTVDLLVEIATHPSGSSYPTHMWKFLSNVLLLGDPLRTALQSGDMDTSNGLCRVLVSLAESHMRLLLSADNEERELQAFSLVQLLLDDIVTQEPSLMAKHKAMYGPVMLSLCQVLTRKVQYPPEDIWQGFTTGEGTRKESYNCFAGSYSEWLKCHPDHLRSVLPVLLGGLSQEQLASASTQALRDICEECVQDMEPSILLEILSHCQAALCGSVMKVSNCGWKNGKNSREKQMSFCLCLERAMGTIRDHMGVALVSSLAELIVGYYNASPSSELLDSASTLVGMYGMVDEHKQTMLFVFQKMTSSTLQLLQHNFREHPDILQSFLQFANRSLKSNPKLVFEPDNRHVNIFQCGLATLDVQESHTVRAACSFFSTFIIASENQETAKNTLSEYGPYLVSQVVKGIAGGVPRQCIDHMAEILFALNRHDISLLSRWMQDVMQVEGFPSSLVSLTQKQDFVKAVLKERAHRRRVRDSVKEFSLLCRGLYGTAYVS
ncbi:PREDICTED: importin-13-like [Acropora digitifera]|uniref:importin-13-like n=1 Tax=Acropora digitifera TaxID=70779 RepID=UPI00077A70A9|nr:PREDICTED: importin-13-like [Acropora digitifera]